MNYKQKCLKYYGYGEQDFIPCMVCGLQASDVHHIKYKSQGGKDNIENLIILCRSCHNKAHFKEKPYLKANKLKEALILFKKFNLIK